MGRSDRWNKPDKCKSFRRNKKKHFHCWLPVAPKKPLMSLVNLLPYENVMGLG